MIKKILKMFLCTCRMQLWQPCQKFFVKTLQTFCSNSRNDEKLMRFPNNIIPPKFFVWTCTMEFWQAFRNFAARKTKNFPELRKCWSYNFLNKFIFFIKNDSLATEIAILTTVANNFLWETTDFQLRFRKPRKKLWTIRKENNFPKIVAMYIYKSICDHPAEIFSSKLWKNFAAFLEMRKN